MTDLQACPVCGRNFAITASRCACGYVLGESVPDLSLARSPTRVRASKSLASPGPVAPVRAATEEVTVWTDRIIWPIICPCCLREADQRATCYHTTMTGAAGQPTRVATCSIPYCSACLWHSRAMQRIQSLPKSTVVEAAKFTRSYRIVLPIVALVLLPFVLFFSGVDSAFGLLGAVLAMLILAPFVIHRFATGGLLRFREITDEQRALEAETEKALTPSCCSLGSAVEFTQKDGAIHTFVFHSAEYAEVFRRLNADNLIGTSLSRTQVKTE